MRHALRKRFRQRLGRDEMSLWLRIRDIISLLHIYTEVVPQHTRKKEREREAARSRRHKKSTTNAFNFTECFSHNSERQAAQKINVARASCNAKHFLRLNFQALPLEKGQKKRRAESIRLAWRRRMLMLNLSVRNKNAQNVFHFRRIYCLICLVKR